MLKRDKLEKGGGSLEELQGTICIMEVKKKKKIGECKMWELGATNTNHRRILSLL